MKKQILSKPASNQSLTWNECSIFLLMGICDQQIWEIFGLKNLANPVSCFFCMLIKQQQNLKMQTSRILILQKWRKSGSSYPLSAKPCKCDRFFFSTEFSLHSHPPRLRAVGSKMKGEIDDLFFSMLVRTCLHSSRREMRSYTTPSKSTELINVFSS